MLTDSANPALQNTICAYLISTTDEMSGHFDYQCTDATLGGVLLFSDVPADSYRIDLLGQGYESRSVTITKTDSGPYSATLVMVSFPFGSVTVYTVDGNGDPLFGQCLVLNGTHSFYGETCAAQEEDFVTLDGVPAGAFTVQPSEKNVDYPSGSASGVAIANQTITITITLSSDNPTPQPTPTTDPNATATPTLTPTPDPTQPAEPGTVLVVATDAGTGDYLACGENGLWVAILDQDNVIVTSNFAVEGGCYVEFTGISAGTYTIVGVIDGSWDGNDPEVLVTVDENTGVLILLGF